MATVISETAGILHELLGAPPREYFDEQQCVQMCMESWAYYRHQAGPAMGSLLTGRFFEIDPPAQDFVLNQDGFAKAIYVQRLVDTVNSIYERVEIVGIQEMDNQTDIGEYAIAFYDQPPNAKLSWDPSLEPFSHLKIWHDPDEVEAGTLDDDLDLPINLLKYMIPRRAVLLALTRLAIKAPSIFTSNVIANIGNVNKQVLAGYEEEWNMWRFQTGEEGWSQMEGTMDRFYRPRRRALRGAI